MSREVRAAGLRLPRLMEARIDETCDRFEAALKSSTRPILADYLGDADGAERTALLRELLLLEMDYRQRLGEAPTQAEYLRLWPEYGTLVDEVFERGAEPRPVTADAGLAPTLDATPGQPWGEPTGDSPELPTVPGYDLLGELGRGGMGVVYKARHHVLKRLVALKMIRAGVHASAAELRRFRNEAEAVACLQHAGIVPIYEIGEHGGRPYFSLEYVERGSLDNELRGTPLDVREAARLVERLARAMAYAHAQGIVHRDLKPANVLLMADGAPRITDFGLAKQMDSDLALTGTGVVGTAPYMAPEQAGAQGDGVSPRTDIYALGAILYELLTGRPPFQGGSTQEILLQVLQEEPIRPSRLRPKVPRDLETICLKCLEKDPARRYDDSTQLADDLERFLGGHPVRARRIVAAVRGWRWCRRNPSQAAMGGLAASLAALILVGSLVASLLLKWEKDRADEKLRGSYLAQAKALRLSGQGGARGRAIELLVQAKRIRPGRDLSDEAAACLALTDLERERELPLEWVTPEISRAFDARLEHFVVVVGDENLSLRRVSDGKEARRLQAGARCWWPGFSPDRRYLVAHVPEGTLLWDLRDPRPGPRSRFPSAHGAPFSPDSLRLACAGDKYLRFYDSATGNLVKEWPTSVGPGYLAYHPGGKQVAVSSGSPPSLTVYDVERGTVLGSWPLTDVPVACPPAWSDDGRLLAVGCYDYRIFVWDMGATPPGPLSVLTGHECVPTHVRFARGGVLISSGWDGSVRLWDAVRGEQLVEKRGELLSGGGNGSGLVLDEMGGRYTAWKVIDGDVYRTLHHGMAGNTVWRTSWATSVGFGSDGRLLASTASDGVRFWDAENGAALEHLPLIESTGRFQPHGGMYLAGDEHGVTLWPVRRAGDGVRVQVGPPRILDGGKVQREATFCWSEDGRRGAFVQGYRVVLFDADEPDRQVVFPHPQVRSVAMSPDGRWLAGGTWKGEVVKVWDVRSREEVPGGWKAKGGSAAVAFSPDGRWLVTKSEFDDYRFWHTGTWHAGPVVPGVQGVWPVAFSGDGTLLAVPHYKKIKLFLAATVQEVASLEAPQGTNYPALALNRDGTRLAAVPMNFTVQLWDLRELRRQLASRGLDWDWPPYPPAPRTKAPGRALEVQVLSGK